MRRVLLLALGLALVSGTAGADFIRYTPPQLLSCASGVFCIPTAMSSFRMYNGSAAEYGELAWSANYFYLRTVTNGGTARGIVLASADGNVTVASAILPDSDDGRNLGLLGQAWKTLFLTRSIEGSKSKALTDGAAAVAVIRVPIASNSYQGGEVIWNAQSTDATDYRTTVGRIRFADISKGAAPTCTVNVVGTDLTASSNANTLVCTWTNVVNTTNCDLSVTCADNTAGNQTMTINFRADMPTGATLVFP